VLLIAVLSAWMLPACGSTKHPKLAVLFGDSLTAESKWAMHAPAGWTLQVHAFGGAGVCDMLRGLPNALAQHPAVLGIETAGDSVTPCMKDRNGTLLKLDSAGYLAKITHDLDTFFAEASRAGVKVVDIEAPPIHKEPWNTALLRINAVAERLASRYPRVTIDTRPRDQVLNNGTYVAYMSCLPGETAAQGCVNGRIAVRTIQGLQRGLHLCPLGLPPIHGGRCTIYSSGEHRFGTAEVEALTTTR